MGKSIKIIRIFSEDFSGIKMMDGDGGSNFEV